MKPIKILLLAGAVSIVVVSSALAQGLNTGFSREYFDRLRRAKGMPASSVPVGTTPGASTGSGAGVGSTETNFTYSQLVDLYMSTGMSRSDSEIQARRQMCITEARGGSIDHCPAGVTRAVAGEPSTVVPQNNSLSSQRAALLNSSGPTVSSSTGASGSVSSLQGRLQNIRPADVAKAKNGPRPTDQIRGDVQGSLSSQTVSSSVTGSITSSLPTQGPQVSTGVLTGGATTPASRSVGSTASKASPSALSGRGSSISRESIRR